MDLLGDIGASDQLTSARSENAVLQEKVKELKERVAFLTVENETLKAEVELYRNDAVAAPMSRLAIGSNKSGASDANTWDVDRGNIETVDEDVFIRSGNGVYPNDNGVTLSKWFGSANPICCTLSHDDTLLASGGANGYINIVPWGIVDGKQKTMESADFAKFVDDMSLKIPMDAPVICASFSPFLSKQHSNSHVIAAGCMDGIFKLVRIQRASSKGLETAGAAMPVALEWKHQKYVHSIAWSHNSPIMATASADGTVQIFRVHEEKEQKQEDNGSSEADCTNIRLERLESLHFPGAVESLTIANDNQLICYARNTPYLSVFDMSSSFKQSRIHLNLPNGKTIDDHVSFAVMDLNLWQDKYVVAATDSARNIILDLNSGKQIRNLYGHTNDAYSQPKAVWSCNGQYVLGNTQDEGALCVWDIASSRMVERITKAHNAPIRHIYSSSMTDTMATASFDKQIKLWFAPTIA